MEWVMNVVNWKKLNHRCWCLDVRQELVVGSLAPRLDLGLVLE
jgi:hypothetical protein